MAALVSWLRSTDFPPRSLHKTTLNTLPDASGASFLSWCRGRGHQSQLPQAQHVPGLMLRDRRAQVLIRARPPWAGQRTRASPRRKVPHSGYVRLYNARTVVRSKTLRWARRVEDP